MNDLNILALAEDLVEAAPGTLSLHDALDSIGWDSIVNIEFIASVDDRIGLSIDAQQLAGCRTLADVDLLLRSAR